MANAHERSKKNFDKLIEGENPATGLKRFVLPVLLGVAGIVQLTTVFKKETKVDSGEVHIEGYSLNKRNGFVSAIMLFATYLSMKNWKTSGKNN